MGCVGAVPFSTGEVNDHQSRTEIRVGQEGQTVPGCCSDAWNLDGRDCNLGWGENRSRNGNADLDGGSIRDCRHGCPRDWNRGHRRDRHDHLGLSHGRNCVHLDGLNGHDLELEQSQV